MKTKRKFYPNVHRKRLFSYTLDTWVRFQVTTTALREIDTVGGIDNYLMKLDDKSVARSNYVTKIHRIISISLFHQGKLTNKQIKKFGFDVNPPPPLNYGDPNVTILTPQSTPYGDRTTSNRKLQPVGIQRYHFKEEHSTSPSKPDPRKVASTSPSITQTTSSSSSSSARTTPTDISEADAIPDSDIVEGTNDSKVDIIISPFSQPDTPFIEDLDLVGEVIYIRNPSQSVEVDISGWQVSDQNDKHKWMLPEGTLLPPDSSMQIYCDSRMVEMNDLSEHHVFWTNKVYFSFIFPNDSSACLSRQATHHNFSYLFCLLL